MNASSVCPGADVRNAHGSRRVIPETVFGGGTDLLDQAAGGRGPASGTARSAARPRLGSLRSTRPLDALSEPVGTVRAMLWVPKTLLILMVRSCRSCRRRRATRRPRVSGAAQMRSPQTQASQCTQGSDHYAT